MVSSIISFDAVNEESGRGRLVFPVELSREVHFLTATNAAFDEMR
jgi:hypothetical protein